MFNLLSNGIATSARHVVGLHDPPKNTSGAGVLSAGSLSDRNAIDSAVEDDGDDDDDGSPNGLSFSGHFIGAYTEPCVRNRFKSAASTQNSPNVKPFIGRCDRDEF